MEEGIHFIVHILISTAFAEKNMRHLQHTIPLLLYCVIELMPMTVAEWSKARTVFARLDAGIVGSNPTQGMDV
jgi:hypothetical protein